MRGRNLPIWREQFVTRFLLPERDPSQDDLSLSAIMRWPKIKGQNRLQVYYRFLHSAQVHWAAELDLIHRVNPLLLPVIF